MKRLLVPLCLTLLLCACSSAPVSDGAPDSEGDVSSQTISSDNTAAVYDFRSVAWGMTKEEVLGAEELAPLEQSELSLTYKVEVAGYEAALLYLFEKGRLLSAGYVFDVTRENQNDYVTDFDNLRDMYAKVYGKPESIGQKWYDETYKGNSGKYGLAIASGHMEYLASWQTETTEVHLVLNGGEGEIFLGTVYRAIGSEPSLDGI